MATSPGALWLGRSYSANVGGSAPDYPRWKYAGMRRGRGAVFAAVAVGRPADRRLRLERDDQVLIAGISGPTPKIEIIRFRL